MKKHILLILPLFGLLTFSCTDDDCTNQTWYIDVDGDGFGNPDETLSVMSCAQPEGFVADNTDCDDSNSTNQKTWFLDADSDGFGSNDIADILVACLQPEGYIEDNTDCDDTDNTIFPGATDAPTDGIDSDCGGEEETIIWTGTDLTFNKAANADWTLTSNQDRLTEKVVFTRQNNKQIYNYQWWQDEFGQDVSTDDLFADFWDAETILNFTPSGGTKGVKWTLLDDTGSTTAWDEDFGFYGTLGDPTHFYSFRNIASMIEALENGQQVTEVTSDFGINGNQSSGASMPQFVGKNLGVWLVEEDIYLTLAFTEWGAGNSGGSLGYIRSTPN